MVTYALDTSAYFRFLDNEVGAPRVKLLLEQQKQSQAAVKISAIHWGEIVSVITRRSGQHTVVAMRQHLRNLGVEIMPVSAERAERAGLLVANYKIPYADAFGVELAADSPEHVLVTADFDVKSAAAAVTIEFLPAKA